MRFHIVQLGLSKMEKEVTDNWISGSCFWEKIYIRYQPMKFLILSYSSAIIYDAGSPCIPLFDESEFGDYPVRHHLEKQWGLIKTIKVFLILLTW